MNKLITLALLLGASAPALADLAPPPDQKRVPYAIEVQNMEAFPDHVFKVWPWSDSNGRPMAEVGHFLGTSIGFGRRIDGAPVLYAVKKPDWDGFTEADADPGAFFGKKGIRCDAAIAPRHTAPSGGPDRYVDVFRIESVDDAACKTSAVTGRERVEPTPTPTPTPAKAADDKGCATVAAPAMLPAAFGLAALVLLGRRRRS